MTTERRLAWLELARRHLGMARVLLEEYPDGAFFHAYHAFECSLCGEILRLDPEESIPVGHADKIDLLMNLVGDSPVADRIAALRTHLDRRNEALYVGWRGDSIRKPGEVFARDRVRRILDRVTDFVGELERRA